MKSLLVIVFICILQHTWCMSVDDLPCSLVFAQKICDDFEALDTNTSDDHNLTKRQEKSDVDTLSKMLADRLQFFIGFGLLPKTIAAGKTIRDFVANHSDAVELALVGGLPAILKLGMEILLEVG